MFWLCRTCGVEHDKTSDVCAICADDRQWVPREGQQWATLQQLAPSVSVVRVGGHFPGSAVACWRDGADGRGVLLAMADTLWSSGRARLREHHGSSRRWAGGDYPKPDR